MTRTRRQTHRGRRRQAPPPVATLDRAQAVDRLAAHLTTRDAHLLAIAPTSLAHAARRLAPLTGTSYYLDTGEGDLLAVTGPAAAALLTRACRDKPPAAVTVAVVPARHVAALAALGIDLPQGAPHPFSVLGDQDGLMVWPVFLLDALERVDPAGHARILASLVKPGGAP